MIHRAQRIVVPALLSIALATCTAACGSSSNANGATSHASVATVTVTSAATPTVAATTTSDPAEYDTCKSQIGAWLMKLNALNSRLDVGMNESAYNQYLSDISVLYGELPTSSLSPQCLKVGVPAEHAMNTYNKANNFWRGCIQSLSCTDSEETATLQKKWGVASIYLAKANRVLNGLNG